MNGLKSVRRVLVTSVTLSVLLVGCDTDEVQAQPGTLMDAIERGQTDEALRLIRSGSTDPMTADPPPYSRAHL
ncbi:MAG: hypothetical protein ABIQ73_07325, partial [Acidimicrobiales bacterium]